MDWIKRLDTPLGPVTLASDGEALTGLWFEGQAHFAETLDAAHGERELPVFEETERWLRLYFSGAEPDFMPKLAPRGTAFRQKVWARLLRIPYGETSSYGALAAGLGPSRPSARAVGAAVGRNPISILIPCHRVIGADGSLRGYAGGPERKAALLRLEREALSRR